MPAKFTKVTKLGDQKAYDCEIQLRLKMVDTTYTDLFFQQGFLFLWRVAG